MPAFGKSIRSRMISRYITDERNKQTLAIRNQMCYNIIKM